MDRFVLLLSDFAICSTQFAQTLWLCLWHERVPPQVCLRAQESSSFRAIHKIELYRQFQSSSHLSISRAVDILPSSLEVYHLSANSGRRHDGWRAKKAKVHSCETTVKRQSGTYVKFRSGFESTQFGDVAQESLQWYSERKTLLYFERAKERTRARALSTISCSASSLAQAVDTLPSSLKVYHSSANSVKRHDTEESEVSQSRIDGHTDPSMYAKFGWAFHQIQLGM